jgi:glycosyltransferase involved in cell wall biosynthesis
MTELRKETRKDDCNSSIKPRLLVVGPTPPPDYGVATATHTILNSFLGEQYELVHLDTSDRRAVPNFGRWDFTNMWLAVRHIMQLVWRMHRSRSALVYLPVSQGSAGYLRDAVFIFVAALFRARIVLHLRGAYFRQFYEAANAPMKWLIRQSLVRADRMIVLGECLRGLFQGLIPDDRIRVVPNGVDPREFTVSEKASHDGQTVRLGYLGSLRRSKGYLDLLKAFDIFKDKYPVECYFAGEWRSASERDSALQYIQAHGLGDKVKFLGVVGCQQKVEFLRSCDVFVFPTYYKNEGQPWVILEAMAAGLPVITTKHGCLPETVLHCETGLIVQKQNVGELAWAIETLLRDPALRSQMGKRCRQRLERELSKDIFITRLREVFAELVPLPPKTN